MCFANSAPLQNYCVRRYRKFLMALARAPNGDAQGPREPNPALETRKVRSAPGAQPRYQSWGVQFLGPGYCTEQNTDGIPSFMHCYVKSWGGPSNFGGLEPPPTPSGCALDRLSCRRHVGRT